MSVGLLVLRLLLAGLLAGHAAQKLFGWFRGTGPTATTFETWGFRPGLPMVLLAGASEATAALLLAAGLATPLAAAIVIGTMAVAASPNVANGLWAHMGGYEVALVYGVLGLVLALTGPGDYSLDALLGLDSWHGPMWALLAIGVAAVAATPPLLLRRRNLAATDR